MARKVTEFSCLLISPGDVNEARDAVVDAIERWNAMIGAALNARVRVVRWETDGVPDASAPPQEVLNRQFVDECDFGIAVFWTRLGTPTGSYPSGSVEEIQRLRERGAQVLVYTCSAPIPQAAANDEQFKRLSDFKESLRTTAYVGSYSDVLELREQVLLHVASVVSGLLEKDRGQVSSNRRGQEVLTAPIPDVRVVVFPAALVPKHPSVKHLVGIRIQNHSPVTVFVSGISIQLKSGTGLLLVRDSATGREQSRVPLRSGESLMWSADGDSILRDVAIDDIDGVVAYDDVGRQFREPEGTLAKILRDWKTTDERQAGDPSTGGPGPSRP